jgi:Flp pilus assembly protein TadD
VFVLSLAPLLSASCLLLGQSSSDNSLQQHMAKAEQSLRAGDMAGAEREYHEILALDPQNSQAWTGLGVLLYGSGKAEASRPALQSALNIDPAAKTRQNFSSA